MDCKEIASVVGKRGTTNTTEIGYVNRNEQEVLGHRTVESTDHCQPVYKIECRKCGK